MRIPSGTTDQVIYFVAVDPTDKATRETALTTFTVARSRNGGTATAMTTPTVAEVSATLLPGVYTLLLDEDMTITAGNDSEEMVFHITQASMEPVTRTIELYRPKVTLGNTLDVTVTGAAGIDWGNVENPTTTLDLSATSINLCDTVTTNTDMRGTDSALLAASAPTNFGDLSITVTTGLVNVSDKTGFSLAADQSAVTIGTVNTMAGTITTLDALDTAQDIQHSATQADIAALNNVSTAQVNAEVVDALATDTYVEPGQGAPAATASLAAKINYLYKNWRNKKEQTSSTFSLYDDAGTTVDQKSTVADNGTTASKAEIVSGP